MLAVIPYKTFPDFQLGPITIRSFGMLVAAGILLGAWLAAREVERWGVERDETYRLAMRMVIWGLIGSRASWVVSHLDQIDSPIDLIALWEGGIQFTGGFIAGVIAGYPTFRKWEAKYRFRNIDGYAYGLTVGLAIGRIGCYSVGEHFGRTTSFFLGTEYLGGGTQESTIGDVPLVEGMIFHQTALYEFFHLMVLFAIMTWLLYVKKERSKAGTIIGLFALWYGIGRFLTDTLRVSDNRTLGLTGAQWGSVLLAVAGLYILLKRRHDPDLDLDFDAEADAGSDSGSDARPTSDTAAGLGSDAVADAEGAVRADFDVVGTADPSTDPNSPSTRSEADGV